MRLLKFHERKLLKKVDFLVRRQFVFMCGQLNMFSLFAACWSVVGCLFCTEMEGRRYIARKLYSSSLPHPGVLARAHLRLQRRKC